MADRLGKPNLREIWLTNQIEKLCQKKVMSYKNSQIPTLPKEKYLTAVIPGTFRTSEQSHGMCFHYYSPPTASISEWLLEQWPALPDIKYQ